MGFKPISTKKFKKYLKKKGLVHKRTKGDHEVWDYPPGSDKSLLRPVIIRGHKTEIPGLHIKTCLSTLGVSYDEFLKEI